MHIDIKQIMDDVQIAEDDLSDPDTMRQLDKILDAILFHEEVHCDADYNKENEEFSCTHLKDLQKANHNLCTEILCPDACAGLSVDKLCARFKLIRDGNNKQGLKSCGPEGWVPTPACECSCNGDPAFITAPCE